MKTPNKLTELTISRKRWLTPEYLQKGEAGSLFDCDLQRLCCLGLASEALGYSLEDLSHKCFPHELLSESVLEMHDNLMQIIGEIPEGADTGEFEYKAAGINENRIINNTEREQQLIAHFASAGIKLSFID